VVRELDILHPEPLVRWLKQYKAQGNAHPKEQDGVSQPLQHVPEGVHLNLDSISDVTATCRFANSKFKSGRQLWVHRNVLSTAPKQSSVCMHNMTGHMECRCQSLDDWQQWKESTCLLLSLT
jgi:hypothetical protein